MIFWHKTPASLTHDLRLRVFEDWGCSINPSFTSNLESIVIGGRQIPTEPLGEHMREGARASACVLMLPLLPGSGLAREPARLSCSFSNSVASSGHPLKNAHFLLKRIRSPAAILLNRSSPSTTFPI